ncbi:MAG: IS1595 family transposase [Sphingomonas phyllosphaerae]
MAQHFLLSSRARTLSLDAVLGMDEEAARAKFTQLRWPDTDGAPVCPECGGLEHWTLAEGRKWKCQACGLQFTATSRTILASRKLPFRKLLGVVALFANGVLGVSACRMSRDLCISYKAAFVLLHKIREAMGQDDATSAMSGVVEMDGAIFGGSLPRLPNKKELWDEFKKKNKAAARKKRKLIVVMRERQGDDPTVPGKVRTFLLPKEGDAIEIARRMVLPGSIIHADRSTQWEALHLHFDTKRIDHSKSFSDGVACTNQAESFFSRMRAAERGVHLHISGAHMPRYAWELAWREQYRRKPNGEQFAMIIGAAGRAKPSGTFRGYWRKRGDNDNDLLAAIAS